MFFMRVQRRAVIAAGRFLHRGLGSSSKSGEPASEVQEIDPNTTTKVSHVGQTVRGVAERLSTELKQSTNRTLPWSPDQRPRFDAYLSSPRFSGVDLEAQVL